MSLAPILLPLVRINSNAFAQLFRRDRSAPALKLAALIPQKRPVDLLRIEIDVSTRHAAFHEVLLPSIYDLRNGLRLFDRVVLCKPEHLRHRQGVGDSRVGFLLPDSHLLKAERLTRWQDV